MLDVGSLTTTFRTAVTGFSLATVHLVTARPVVTTPQADAPVVEHAISTTTQPDGREDSRIGLYATPTGLSSAGPLKDQGTQGSQADGKILATSLRDMSSLPVETLAEIVGVSKVTYHKWLRGFGIHPEHATRMEKLVGALESIGGVRGGNIRQFLEHEAVGGRPLDLLRCGDFDAVVGLALLQPQREEPRSLLSDEARGVSGVAGWFRPVAPLGWGKTALTEQAGDDELERLSPSSWYRDVNPSTMPLPQDSETPVTHIRFAL